MSQQKRHSYRKACIHADREGDDRPSKRGWRKRNRKGDKAEWMQYLADARRRRILTSAILTSSWPDNHALWMEYNLVSDRMTRAEMRLGLKAVIWRLKSQKGEAR